MKCLRDDRYRLRDGAERGKLRSGLAKLLRTAPGPRAGIGKGPPRRAERQEVVENDAGPLDLIGVEQQPAARNRRGIETEARAHAIDEVLVMGERHRHFRLAEEIRDELGRVVTAGVFENW